MYKIEKTIKTTFKNTQKTCNTLTTNTLRNSHNLLSNLFVVENIFYFVKLQVFIISN